MIGKLIAVIIALGLLAFSLGFLYQNLPGEPKEFLVKTNFSQKAIDIDYGPTPVFSENLRFGHNNITYFIESSCTNNKINSMLNAFDIIGGEVDKISFSSSIRWEADILIGCSEDYIELSENLFVAGEGGPSEIIDTGLFNLVRRGKISLYEDPKCDYPVVEVHELLHVLGFNHSEDPTNVMYNISDCEQRITQDAVGTLSLLYSIESLPDLLITNLSAIKNGRYLDFNITIRNQGLADSSNSSLVVSSSIKEIGRVEFGEISPGAGRKIQIQNMRMFSRSLEEIDFTVDGDNTIHELNKENNHMQMIISQ
jgi:hypothetical protein